MKERRRETGLIRLAPHPVSPNNYVLGQIPPWGAVLRLRSEMGLPRFRKAPAAPRKCTDLKIRPRMVWGSDLAIIFPHAGLPIPSAALYPIVPVIPGRQVFLILRVAEDVRGTIYTVEMQAYYQRDFPQRALYHWARAYGSQLGRSARYQNLKPVIDVNLAKFLLLADRGRAHHVAGLRFLDGRSREPEHTVPAADRLTLHYLELPKLSAVASTGLGRRMYHLAMQDEEEEVDDSYSLQVLREDPTNENAEERYRQFVADDPLREKYEDRIKFLRDEDWRRERPRRSLPKPAV